VLTYDPIQIYRYVCARLNVDTSNDRGMTTTEVAVITFLLVGAAIVVLGIIYAAAQNNANSIPTPSAPNP
jgi:hypothetical protein